MDEPLEISDHDAILDTVDFRPYISNTERHAEQFLPPPDAPQTVEVHTPWGGTLLAQAGDYIVNDVKNRADCWVVEREIFETTYHQVRPGRWVKSAITYLAPLTDLTGQVEDRTVTIHTLEGPVTVRAGDFYLARGAQGELWAIPNEKVHATMQPVD